MAPPALTTEPPIGLVDEEEDRVGDESDGGGEVRKRVSRLAVEGDAGGAGAGAVRGGRARGGGGYKMRQVDEDAAGSGVRARRFSGPGGAGGGRTLPPPHAWLAVEESKRSYGSDSEEQWVRVLAGGAGAQRPQRRSSFSVVRRERAAREAWLDRAWEMKKSWHERNGGAPDADTPVVVVVGKGVSSPSAHAAGAGAVGGGGVAMDMEEVRACRDLGLELPSDCTVEIQCYGLSAASSPTTTASSGGGGGGDSPSAPSCSVSSPGGVDPTDVKARLKVWAQAVALASTTHLGSS